MLPLLLAVDYLNFTYPMNPCSKNVPVPVVMRKGAFSYSDKAMGTGFDLYVRGVYRGSLRSGTRQAVVVITCDYPIGGVAAAYAFAEHGSTATLLRNVASAAWGGDWGRGPDSIHVHFTNGRLIVDACAPSGCERQASTTYVLRGAKLVAAGVTTRPNPDVLRETEALDLAAAKRLRTQGPPRVAAP